MEVRAQNIEAADVQTLAAILELERAAHCRTRSLCFGLFVFCFVLLVAGLAIAVLFLTGADRQLSGGSGAALAVLQVLSVLSGGVFGFFSLWWAAQNCIHTIERTLFAAKAGRHQLFLGFVEQLQCAGKKKREIIIDLLKSGVT